MDKFEYKIRAEEIKSLIAQGEYVEAVKIADTIDWHRVKSVMMLCTISDLYKINRRFEESKELLLLAYERHPGGRTIVYSLCELSIKMEEYVQAIEYYKEFVQIAPRDSGRYILQYKLYEAQDVSLEERIAVLEELKKRDYREKWAYELAYLYHRIGLSTKCVEECDELILWFGEGKYVIKAMELKMLHQPLTHEQEKRYEMQMRGISMYDQYEQEDEEQGGQQEEEVQDAILTAATTRIGGDELDDIHVKTLDMGQYNTINLQKELAASMKELLDDGTDVDESLEDESTDRITKTILAPMFENTEELAAAVQEASQSQPEPQPVEEEVFFEETGEMPEVEQISVAEEFAEEEFPEIEGYAEEEVEELEEIPETEEFDGMEELSEIEELEEMEELSEIEELEEMEELSETEEIEESEELSDVEEFGEVEELAEIEELSEVEAVSEVEEPDRASVVMQQMREEATNKTAGSATYQILPEVPAPLAGMLSQEYDGQISLVVPESEKVEKQITGQMSIEDILAEWERMKRDNQEKRKEDVRRRVQEQTGNMFAEFDESTKSGILAQLDELDADAKEKEAAKPPITPYETEIEETEEIVEPEEVEELPPEEIPEVEIEDIDDEDVEENIKEDMETQESEEAEVAKESETEVKAVEDEEAVDMAEEASESEEGTEAEEETDEAEIEEIAGETEEAEEEKQGEISESEMEDIVDERMTLRQLTDEEKELFSSFIHTRKAKEQFIKSIDSISLAAYTGNIIVTGDDHNDNMSLAKNLVKEVQMTDSNFSGKVAKISGAALNKKDVETTLSRMENGAVIIENAVKMNEETVAKLHKYLDRENKGIIVVIEGTRKEINKFLKQNDILTSCFTARFDIEALDDDALAAYGRKYAELMEYSIDELGMLALHTRISELQTSTHVVNVAEVQEIVDDAIYHANRKNLRHFFDILLAKRYDEEDMIILRERDFN